MIAVDTNVLVHAHRTESPRHEQARAWIFHLAEGQIPWGLPVFCMGEFVRVVTHRRLFAPPSTLEQALAALEGLLKSPSLRLLAPSGRFPTLFSKALRDSGATGNLAFDAQIAAVCREHGIDTLLSEDRDFARFPGLQRISLTDSPPR